MADLPDMLDDEPTPGERAQALVAALRARSGAMAPDPERMASIDNMRQLGTLGQLTGDRVISPAGTGLLHQAQQEASLEAMAPTRRLLAESAAQRASNTSRITQDREEGTGAFGKGLIKYGTNALGQVEAQNTSRPEVTMVDDNKRPAKLLKGGKGGGGGSGLNTKEEAIWQRADKALNPSTAAGELGASQKRVNSANRVLALVDDGKGGVRDLDKREVMELATSLQSLLSPGGHSQAEVEHLVPQTYQGDVQGYLEKLSGEPNGLGMRKFVEKMRHTVERERDVSHEAMLSAQYGAVPGVLSGLYKSNPERAKALLKARGLNPDDLDENLVRRAKAPAPAHAAPAGDAKSQLVARIAALKATGVTDPKAIREQLAKEGLKL
jgi:hypothetical protein